MSVPAHPCCRFLGISLLLLSLAAGRLVQSLLHNVSALDPASFAVVPAALGGYLQQPDLFVERNQQGRLLDLLQAETGLFKDLIQRAAEVPDQRRELGQQGRSYEGD